MQTTMDLAAIQAFAKVVQTGSFTRAAEALQTHKAHLSRVVSQLERELGARLLERSTRSLSLTEVGREFHERSLPLECPMSLQDPNVVNARATVILAAVEDARQAVAQSQGAPRGTLRLTCGVEFGMLAVSGWINRYLAQYPQMKVEADITGRIVDVVHEGFDLAIRVGTLPDSTLTARRLGTLTYGLYAAPAYLQRCGTPQAPADLTQHDVLVFTPGSGPRTWRLERQGDTHRVDLQQARFRAGNGFAVRDACVAGLGIALLPRLVADPLLPQAGLRQVLADWSSPEVPVSAVFASARFLAPKVRAFIELAHASFVAGPTGQPGA
jgi:LysR family transcriptional regulator, regulator for bpeEF and oprC